MGWGGCGVGSVRKEERRIFVVEVQVPYWGD